MSHRMRSIVALLAVAALAIGVLGVAGCQPTTTTTGPTTTEPVKGGTLTIGYEQEPQILNSFVTGGDMMATKDVESNVLLGLIRIKPDFTYEPMLAESIPDLTNGGVTENPFTVTWKLKKEAVWSDGTPVSADDVKFTFDTIMSSKWQILSKSGYEEITSAEVIDPKTIKFTFKAPYAPYRELFSASYMVLPKHALEGKDFNTVMNESIPVASGPFMFKEWKKGDHITLARNEKFWGTPAFLDQVVFKWVPDTNTEIAQMKTGEVDAVNPSPDPSLIDQLKTAGDVQADPGTVWEHLAFNLEKPDVSDVKVRQAIAYSIDRQKIVDQVMLGQVKALNGIFVPEQKEVFSADWEIYKPDKAKADALLTEAGYVKGANGYLRQERQDAVARVQDDRRQQGPREDVPDPLLAAQGGRDRRQARLRRGEHVLRHHDPQRQVPGRRVGLGRITRPERQDPVLRRADPAEGAELLPLQERRRHKVDQRGRQLGRHGQACRALQADLEADGSGCSADTAVPAPVHPGRQELRPRCQEQRHARGRVLEPGRVVEGSGRRRAGTVHRHDPDSVADSDPGSAVSRTARRCCIGGGRTRKSAAALLIQGARLGDAFA